MGRSHVGSVYFEKRDSHIVPTNQIQWRSMKSAEFKRFATYVVGRNVSKRVDRVFAHFDTNRWHLSLIYCVNELPTDDDEDDLELSCAEILGEYPEIRTAETHCLPSEECQNMNRDDEVYSKQSS